MQEAIGVAAFATFIFVYFYLSETKYALILLSRRRLSKRSQAPSNEGDREGEATRARGRTQASEIRIPEPGRAYEASCEPSDAAFGTFIC